ncbi:MAG: pyridoxamine 5'-phosphate oxidase family protein [Bacteroidales bacterium]|nr:pyridoxamine 5'-phosphate oxidase family protein [Bacteroidales bacterium]
MNIQDCNQFAAQNPNCFLATMDGNQPRVRTVLIIIADETGFYFKTFLNKKMNKQMHANSKETVSNCRLEIFSQSFTNNL